MKRLLMMIGAAAALGMMPAMADTSKIAYWTGGGDRSNVNDPANWAITNSLGEAVADAVPDADTAIGDCKLTADCDWRGLAAFTNDYIDVPNGAYIDTGFKPNQDTRVVVDVTVGSTKEYWFGCWNSAFNNGAFAVGNDGSKLFSGYGNSGGGVAPIIGIGRHTVELDKGIVKVDGATHTDRSGQAAFQLNYNLYLFAQNRKGSTKIPDDQGTIRFHSCKIYDNGTLVRDYVPTNNGTAFGLYDKANGTFSASANDSAPFTGEIVAPEINGTVDLAGHSLLLASTAGSGTITDTSGYIDVPKGYYIDTGFKPNQDTRVVVDVTVRNTMEYWFGCWNSAFNDGAFAVCNDGGKLFSGYGNSGGGVAPIIGIGRHTVELDKGIVKVDGATHTDRSGQASFQLNYNLYLFAQNRKGSTKIPDDQGAIRFHSCKIYDNGTLVRDYIPSNKGTEFGLYEKVSGAFNPLSGSGAESATGVVAGGELHIDIKGGRIDGENTALTLAGSLKLVKDGAGTFIGAKSGQTYTGGTLVNAGLLKSGVSATPWGAAKALITVADSGAAFDWGGKCSNAGTPYSFNIKGTGIDGGGAIVFTPGTDANSSTYCIGDLELAGDALVVDPSANNLNTYCGFVQGFPHTLTMNGHTLTVKAGSKFNFVGVTATDAGTIKFTTDATDNPNKRLVSFWGQDNLLPHVTLDIATNINLNADSKKKHVVGTFIDRGIIAGSGNVPLIVLDRFQPMTTTLNKAVTLGDETHLSPVLDLSGLDAPFVVPSTGYSMSMASGATVQIKLGDRNGVSRTPIITWDGEKPSWVDSLRFVRGDSNQQYGITVREDGIYAVSGLIITIY